MKPTRSQIIVPVAAIAAASQALLALPDNGKELAHFDARTSYDEAAQSAVMTARGQQIVRQASPSIARHLRIDAELLDAAYVEMAATEHLVDSTNQSGIFNCYSNCHTACHGSRGWR